MRRLLNPDLLNHDLAKEMISIIKEKGEKIKAENNPPGGLYEVYKINIMMSVLKV